MYILYGCPIWPNGEKESLNMKVQVDPKEKVFIPFKFTVEIETKEEALKFFVILNHLKINEILDLCQGFVEIRDLLKEKAGIKYEDYRDLFSNLNSLMKS